MMIYFPDQNIAELETENFNLTAQIDTLQTQYGNSYVTKYLISFVNS
jgi:hypothetical protein